MKRNSSTLIYISLAILSLLLLICTVAICYTSLLGGKKTRYVARIVPALVGKVWDEGALPEGFFPGISYAFDQTHPAGTVLSQSPAAGTVRTTKAGQPVHLRVVISLGKQTARMPDLRGSDVRQAEQRLRALGLLVNTRGTYDATRSGYCVISQSRAPGTELPLGTQVTLVYACAAPIHSALVPDLQGLERTQANTALLRAGLLPGNVSFSDLQEAQDKPDTLDFCTVCAQAIPQGSRVPVGTKIDYTLSRTVTPWNFPIAEESSKESADFTQ